MAMRYTIPLSYNPIDVPRLTEVLARYKEVHHNQMIIDFEEALQKTTGAAHVLSLNSGTAAIHLALKVLGIGPGDVVIVPAFTYVATVNPIRYLGAEPVFVDSELDTWNMDPDLLEKAIEDLKSGNKLPKAIMVVHTYGMPSKMDEILRLADRHGIPVIEDAAESLGSTYNGKPVGTLGAMGIYSFNNNKVVTTYGGGAITLKSAELAQKVRFYASQAREQLPYYEHREVGYNYAMSPLCAAAGLSQLPQLNQNIEERRRIFQRYRNEFSGFNIKGQPERDANHANRWFSAFTFTDEATRLRVSSVLGSEGIETRPLWRPMHQQTVYQHVICYLNGISDQFFKTGLCLPSGAGTDGDRQEKVIEFVKTSLS
jgi:pyridoxal phosphate-dependent aminotransferase EpsN